MGGTDEEVELRWVLLAMMAPSAVCSTRVRVPLSAVASRIRSWRKASPPRSMLLIPPRRSAASSNGSRLKFSRPTVSTAVLVGDGVENRIAEREDLLTEPSTR